jgi:hypothetical protein
MVNGDLEPRRDLEVIQAVRQTANLTKRLENMLGPLEEHLHRLEQFLDDQHREDERDAGR